MNLLSPRIWPTKAATGMRGASGVPSAVAHLWRSHLLPRTRSCCVPNATLMSIHPSVFTARRPLCQVRQQGPFGEQWNRIFNNDHLLEQPSYKVLDFQNVFEVTTIPLCVALSQQWGEGRHTSDLSLTDLMNPYKNIKSSMQGKMCSCDILDSVAVLRKHIPLWA